MEEVVTQSAQPTVQPPPIPTTSKKKSNTGLIAILLVAILLIGAGGVYAGMQFQKGQLSLPFLKSTPTIAPQPTAIPISDETVDWQTYTDTKYQYSFNYPKSWADQSRTEDKDLGNFTIESKEGEKIHGVIFSGVPDIENDIKNNGSSKSFVINKQKYLFVTYVECDGPRCNLSRRHLDIFTKVLSTFKFTDQKADEMANWKTYKNDKYGFEFRYPTYWGGPIEDDNSNNGSPSFFQVEVVGRQAPTIRVIVWKKDILQKGGEKVMLGGKDAYRNTSESPEDIMHDIVVATKGSYDYALEMEYASEQKVEYLPIFEKSISTFKFTN